ncbi:MAG: diacylglycerol kinase family lipid kinase [Brevinematales bacterium]|nr:diacylglycerol kinase family lipid kinase [Brevinematales bacterium]
MLDNFLIIVNPYSGNGKPIKVLPVVKKVFDEHNINYKYVITSCKENAKDFINQWFEKGFDNILLLGGDGTINELLQDVINKNITIGVLPVGSGNDMAKNLGFKPPFKKEYILDVINGVKKYVDIGKCNDRYFCNELGIGFAAKVAHDYNKSFFLRGKAKYYFQIFKNIIFYKARKIFVNSNSNYNENIFLISIGNGKTTGGGVPLTINAEIDDGYLDVCLIRDLPLVKRLENLLKALKGKHLTLPYVTYFKTNRIEIESDEEMIAHMDGEMFKTKKMELTILPKRLKFIFNQK